MTDIPFFSVIIPTYNRLPFLQRAVASVQAQTFTNYELIVVDDGSTDQTDAWLQLEDIRFCRIPHSGVSAARNFGVQQAKGEWLCFLDSDDRWLPQKLQKQFAFIQDNPAYDLVHGDEIWIRNGVRVNPHNKHRKEGGDIFVRSLELCLISPSVAAIKRQTFLDLGGFREDFPACEDYDLWLKFTAIREVGFIADFLIEKYGGHADQLSQKYKAMDYWRVQSIDHLLSSNQLSPSKRQAAIATLIRKGNILMRGYQKHGRIKAQKTIDTFLKKWHNTIK
jgi:glycosyltransferase involved in cell wall biosynthesis